VLEDSDSNLEVKMRYNQFKTVRWILPILVILVCTVGCGGSNSQKKLTVLEIRPGILAGYLKQEALPDSQAILPPPPVAGSAGVALDDEASRRSFVLRNTLRWEQAIEDAVLRFPRAAESFSCALGLPITEKYTPHLYMLLRRTLADTGFSTYNAKKYYQRKRPFMLNKEPICTPNEFEFLVTNGSYPSGHSAIGWAWALILSEIAPERADAILIRGRRFGESRVICNVHWYSDVVAGRLMGAATVARLHADPAFQAELKAAKNEFDAYRARGLKPARDCEAEADALMYDIFRKQ
jgi:acid phosphatase (class A)